MDVQFLKDKLLEVIDEAYKEGELKDESNSVK